MHIIFYSKVKLNELKRDIFEIEGMFILKLLIFKLITFIKILNAFEMIPNEHHQIHVLKIEYHFLLIFQVLSNHTTFDNPEKKNDNKKCVN